MIAMKNSIPILPKSVALELTYKCNHHCLFCSCPWYAPNSSYPLGKELSTTQWKWVIEKLYDYGVKTFSLSGGEALLRDDLHEIIGHIRMIGNQRKIDYPIILISNGRLMNEEHLKFFKEMNVHLSMSLPGYLSFEEHTGVDNADYVLECFSKAKEIGLECTANITVTKKNYYELFETISLALINGATEILLNRFLPGGRGLKYMNELCLSTEQINGMLDTAEEVLTLANRYGNVGTEIPKCIIASANSYKRIHVGYLCAAAKGFFVIDPTGQIRTCNHSPHIVGNVFEEPWIKDTDYWNKFAFRSYQPTVCNGCSSAKNCDCRCREVTNILGLGINGIEPNLTLKKQ